jgi:hypothetical protein
MSMLFQAIGLCLMRTSLTKQWRVPSGLEVLFVSREVLCCRQGVINLWQKLFYSAVLYMSMLCMSQAYCCPDLGLITLSGRGPCVSNILRSSRGIYKDLCNEIPKKQTLKKGFCWPERRVGLELFTEAHGCVVATNWHPMGQIYSSVLQWYASADNGPICTTGSS